MENQGNQENQEDFVVLRCNCCRKVLCEVSAQTVGQIRKKCDRCKNMAKIRLPLVQKTNTILSGQSVQPA